ncbi:hypothetical protein [Hymenobacter guriensis]|uniref:Uncharacterized protein n=1 Tax=Hymenobacter guriensis TaxID=2793065 RepID=A0ABS0KZN8_9BACT|nr:hypothetical protein [Hymenobacter guriensis]MBG8553170.1 hypothetical protein [Hymenobacter guriensis]
MKMKVGGYKRLKEQSNGLAFSTLTTTLKLLEKDGKPELAQRIADILADEEIDKPSQHDNQNKHASFCYVSLPDEDIESIISMLCGLEVNALDNEYQTTASASFYASLLDNWNDLLLQQSGRDASTSSA